MSEVAHYTYGEVESIDFIEEVMSHMKLDANQAFALGCALKYARRAGFKGDWREDARKCADYLNRYREGCWL